MIATIGIVVDFVKKGFLQSIKAHYPWPLGVEVNRILVIKFTVFLTRYPNGVLHQISRTHRGVGLRQNTTPVAIDLQIFGIDFRGIDAHFAQKTSVHAVHARLRDG